MKKIVLGIFGALVLASCGSQSGTTANSSSVGKAQPSLLSTKWVLDDKVKGKVPTLSIEANKISGNGGCNNYFGTLATDVSTGSFVASQMGSTRMACDNLSSEQNYFQMLSKVTKYVSSGNTLELYQGGLLLLKFKKAE